MDSGEAAIAATMEVIAEARAAGSEVRALGGIGVAMRCPSARRGEPLARDYSDMDLVTNRQGSAGFARTLASLGYRPAERFNLVHGRTRMMFDHPRGMHVDVFVDVFAMCHRLELAPRFQLHDTTIPLAELLLTKLQVAELNQKDVTDAAALLIDHEFGSGDEQIDTKVITGLLGSDWGWWRTVSYNLQVLSAHLSAVALPPATAALVEARVTELLGLIDVAPKSIRWRLRARAGDKVPWRDDPEESH